MENTEIMTNEVMEVTPEFTESGSKIGLVAIIGAAVVGLGFGGYKLYKKLKAKKNQDEEFDVANAIEVEDEDCVEVE